MVMYQNWTKNSQNFFFCKSTVDRVGVEQFQKLETDIAIWNVKIIQIIPIILHYSNVDFSNWKVNIVFHISQSTILLEHYLLKERILLSWILYGKNYSVFISTFSQLWQSNWKLW